MNGRQKEIYEIIKQNPNGIGPTDIGLKLGFDYGQASSRCMGPLKKLISMGLVERKTGPVRYVPAENAGSIG